MAELESTTDMWQILEHRIRRLWRPVASRWVSRVARAEAVRRLELAVPVPKGRDRRIAPGGVVLQVGVVAGHVVHLVGMVAPSLEVAAVHWDQDSDGIDKRPVHHD